MFFIYLSNQFICVYWLILYINKINSLQLIDNAVTYGTTLFKMSFFNPKIETYRSNRSSTNYLQFLIFQSCQERHVVHTFITSHSCCVHFWMCIKNCRGTMQVMLSMKF